MAFVDVEWTAEQVDFTLQMLISKLTDEADSSLSIEKKPWSDDAYLVKNSSGTIYVSIHRDRVFMILNNKSSGSFEPNPFFWKDKPVKASLKQIFRILDEAKEHTAKLRKQETIDLAMDSLIKAFPEVIAREFEKHVLEIKDATETKD